MEDNIDPIDLIVDEAVEQAYFDAETGMWSDEEELDDEDEETLGAMDRF